MSYRIGRVLVIQFLGALWLLVVATQAHAAGNWENGNTQYHSICTNCHNADVTMSNGGGSFPAPSPAGKSATYLQGRFNAGPACTPHVDCSHMGSPFTDDLRTATGGATSPINDIVSDIAAYITKPNYPTASLLPSSYNFGIVSIGNSSQKSFTLANGGDRTLNVGAVSVNDPTNYSVNASACGATVAAGTSCSIIVTFGPQSTNIFNATLTVNHDALGGTSTVALSGRTPPQISPLLLSFTAAAPTSLLTITDPVGDRIRICRTDASTFSFPLDYSLDAPYTLGPDGCFTVTTAPPPPLPRSLNLTVRFTPGATTPRNANLVVQRVDSGGNALGSATTVQLQGNPGPLAMVNASSLFDATADPGVEVDNDNFLIRSVTLSSQGSQPLVFTASSFSITGPNSSEYTLAGGGCQSLGGLPDNASGTAPSCPINVKFNPSDVGRRGPATLLIQISGSPDNTVLLNGLGFRGPRLAVSEGATPLATASTIQFATQTIGGLYPPRTITLRNGGTLGDLEVVFPGAGSVPGFTFVPDAGCTLLAPAAQCNVTLRFAPTAASAYSATFALQTRAAGSADPLVPFSLELRGQGSASAVPVLAWTDTTGTAISRIDFADTTAGNTVDTKVRLRNAGPGGVSLQLLNVVGLDAANFALLPTGCQSGQDLFEGTSCEVTVRFAPGAAGLKTASVQAASSGSAPPVPVTAPLLTVAGTGIASSTPAALTLSAASLQFANTTVGAAALPLELTLSSSGSRSVSVVGYDVALPYSVEAKTCPSLPFTLTPGSACTLTVKFLPQAEGQVQGVLHVRTDATPAVLDVALSATAVPAADVSSGGCSIASGESASDPTLWTLVLLAIAVLLYRNRQRMTQQRAERKARRP